MQSYLNIQQYHTNNVQLLQHLKANVKIKSIS